MYIYIYIHHDISVTSWFFPRAPEPRDRQQKTNSPFSYFWRTSYMFIPWFISLDWFKGHVRETPLLNGENLWFPLKIVPTKPIHPSPQVPQGERLTGPESGPGSKTYADFEIKGMAQLAKTCALDLQPTSSTSGWVVNIPFFWGFQPSSGGHRWFLLPCF